MGNDSRQRWSATLCPKSSKNDLPAPKCCDPEYCIVDEAPKCLSYNLPTYDRLGITVVDPNEGLDSYREETQNKLDCLTVWHVYHGILVQVKSRPLGPIP